MSISPFRGHVVERRPDLPGYPVNQTCAHPDCQREATDNHHALGRGMGWPKKRDYWFVLVDGRWIVPVRIGLCRQHHEDLEGGSGGVRAELMWVEDEGYYWVDMETREGRELDPGPSVEARLAA